MSEILPPVIPPILPSLSGPALSFSSVRKVTDAAHNFLTDLQQKIRTSVQSGLAAAGREGIRLETKVANHIRKQLDTPEQLIDHITSLVQNSIAGNLAQAVTTFEDLTTNKEATGAGVSTPTGGTKQSESFVFTPVRSKQPTPRMGPLRATVPVEAVPGPPVVLGGGTIINLPTQSDPGVL